MANNSQFTGMQPLQPRMVNHMVPSAGPLPPMSMQFRPGAPPPPPQPYIPVAPQQFVPVGRLNTGMLPQPPQYTQAAPLPHPPAPQRPGVAGQGLPQGPPPPPPDFQPRPIMSAPTRPEISNNFLPGFGGPSPAAYNLSSSSVVQQQSNVSSVTQQQQKIPNYSSGGQTWFPTNQNLQAVMPQQQGLDQSAGVRPWFSSANQNINTVNPLQQTGEPNVAAQQWIPGGTQNVGSVSPSQQTKEKNADQVNLEKAPQPEPVEKASSDWREHTYRNGKKYYYNKRMRISSWEKPFELMTPNERADATTDWREFISPDKRKFYYNNVTKKSTWRMPDDVKLAREKTNMGSVGAISLKKEVNSNIPIAVPGIEAPTPVPNNLSSPCQETKSIPVQLTHANPEPATSSRSPSMHEDLADLEIDTNGSHDPLETTTSLVASDTRTPSAVAAPMETSDKLEEAQPLSADATHSVQQEVDESTGIPESGATSRVEGKNVVHEPLVYETKEEAKNAFKALLETANVGSDWNWEQAMRATINDRRYAALKTLGERKQAFNEFVGKKKKKEAEERRARNKKARENFRKMLEESEDLTSSTRWSKAVFMFEKDERFQAIERAKDREDLFMDYVEELKKKERAKTLEEQRRHKMEYLEFLKSCDYIKASSQWRKVQHRLEADERCLRLEKIERLEIFQEYIRDLEKEEEEQRKRRMEELRKAERKNRDEFRKLMEEHVANGTITATTPWRDYCTKVKDAPAYLAVSSNTSGSTAKDLFEDVVEDLEKQYMDDKERIEDAIVNEKISLSSRWTIEDFKASLSKEISSKPVSEINLKLVFDELLEKTKEKEEKEAKKRKRLAEDVHDFLFTSKEISASSRWEDCKPLVEERFVGEESFFLEIFNKVVVELKEKQKAKEKEKKRKDEKAKKEKERKERGKKEKERKEREKKKERKNKEKKALSRKSKERRKKEGTDSEDSESDSVEESRGSRDKSRKRRRRRMDSSDDESNLSKSRRSSANSKKSKQAEKPCVTSSTDSENQSKRQKRDHSDDFSKNEEHKVEEIGVDGEF